MMDITIGKYTLETLTSGMYDRPKDFYREYIQNSVDSLDNAIEQKLITKKEGIVEISIFKEIKKITIEDNGTGMSTGEAEKLLIDIGNSTKRNTKERGFRGIGRLAGLAYCGSLTFETSSAGEERKAIICFNGEKLRKQLLCSDNDINLQTIMSNVIDVKYEVEKKSKHYCKVTLNDVADVDSILDCDSVASYLTQVAPAKFSESFNWGNIISAKLEHAGIDVAAYKIVLSDGEEKREIRKKYSDNFISDRLKRVNDAIIDVSVEVFTHNQKTIAVLWCANTNCYGTIQDEESKSIRVRKGNIQLGNRAALNHIFKDERFNGWLIGELHIISEGLIPNARRDSLEKNDEYYILEVMLKSWAEKVSNSIRKISFERNKEKKIAQTIQDNELSAGCDVKLQELIEPEIRVNFKSENEDVIHSELLNAIDSMLNSHNAHTKYKALNVQSSITVEHKMILERVFDIICNTDSKSSEILVTNIIRGFVLK